MLEWFRARRKEKLENSGGRAEKLEAIEKTNAVADDVLKRMEAIKNDRRHHYENFDGQDRRMHLA